jgi:hypothetical protein
MQTYYIYGNWHRKRGAVHLAECSFCNHGQRTQNTDSGEYGKWRGPFDRNEAFKKVEDLHKEGIDIQPCEVCNP